MYKLIIVDDEEIIRDGLSEHIDWNSIGFEVVGTFEDGADAIAFLQHTPVNAIFTDIQMYQISGIELAKYVKENAPETKVVALSNYREFDYVQQSLEHDVCGYILKPIVPDEVMSTFRKVYDILQKEQRLKKNSPISFSFYASDEYKKIETLSCHLQTSILDGNKDLAINQFKQWFYHIKRLDSQYLFHIILQFFNDLNVLFRKNSVHIPIQLETEYIIGQLNQHSQEKLATALEHTIVEYCALKKSYDNPQNNLIEKVEEYIRKNFDQKLSLEEIAQNNYLNPSYLSREFKRQTGINISQFILDCKMQAVFKLMEENKKYTAKEIAQKVGYCDVRYFHRIFKQYTGHSIKAYQRIMNESKKQPTRRNFV